MPKCHRTPGKTLHLVFALWVLIALFSAGRLASAKKPYHLVYFDAHTHSLYSDGSGTVAQIKATARQRGLSVVIVSDHCTSLTQEKWAALVADAKAASDDNILVLPGIEISGFDGLFHRDHILALGIRDPFVRNDSKERCPEEVWESPLNPDGTGPLHPENLAKWSDYVHRQGGIAVHNHPSGSTRLDYGVDYLEVYNLGQVVASAGFAAAMGYPLDRAWDLGLTINNFALYGERDVNQRVRLRGLSEPVTLRYGLWYGTEHNFAPHIGQWLGAPEAPLTSWDDLLLAYVSGRTDRPILAMANSDAHNTDSLLSSVGLAKNGVYLDNLTAEDFYAALKAGRSFATTGPSLRLEVNGKLMGATAKAARGVARIRLSADPESPDAKIVKIDIYKNGIVWKTLAPGAPAYETTLQDDAVTADGYYRVEITALDPSSGKTTYAWSNPVFVRAP